MHLPADTPTPTSTAPGLPDLAGVTTLLCDADGNLFDSEGPAFDASVRVTNQFLASLCSDRRYDSDHLRQLAMGRNFRRLAADLARELGTDVSEDELAPWVGKESSAVTRHLAEVLRPDEAVGRALRTLAQRFRLAVVTSSALPRVAACLEVTHLADHFPEPDRFSAQDSLPEPTSKPDPAVYLHALRTLRLCPEQALAVEDAEAGVAAAVAAGVGTVGNLVHVPASERFERRQALAAAGAARVVDTWDELVGLVMPRTEGDL